MQFAATLVEYLVIGITALVWATPVMRHYFDYTPALDEKTVVLLLPFLYVLGMYIDSLASLLLTGWKRRVEKAGAAKSPTPAYAKTVEILVREPELAAPMQALVTRDRIARGVFLNAVIAFFVSWIVVPGLSHRNAWMTVTAITAFVGFCLWRRFDRLTDEFKERTIASLDRRDAREDARHAAKK